MEQTARVLEPRRTERTAVSSALPEFGWRVLGLVGLLLAVVGGQDLVLALVPLNIGNPEWEFGTVTAVLNGMPVLTVGLALLLTWSARLSGRWLVRTLGVVLLLLAATVLLAFTLYALTVPVALRSIQDPMILLGLKKAIVKTAVQAVMYPLVFVVLGIAAFRYSPKN